MRQVAITLFFDLGVMAPPGFGSFLFWCKFLEEGEVDGAIEHTKCKFYEAMLISYSFWLPTHCITYGFIPLRHRVVWVNGASVVGGGLLSWVNSKKDAGQSRDESATAAAAAARPT